VLRLPDKSLPRSYCQRSCLESGNLAPCQVYSVPVQRRSIEHPVLKTKKLDMGEPTQILSLALQPPSKVDVEKAVTNLKELGALTVTCGGVVNPVDGDLTFVGSLLEALPISARLGRLILLGHVFDCLEETVVIAAALSRRSIFTGLFNNEMKAYRSKIGWMERTSSDCIAVLFAYKEWIRLQKVGYFSTSKRKEANWCSDNMLHLNGLREVAETVRDLSARLDRFRIQVQRDLANTEMNKTDILILKVVLCGAFYPNYFRWGVGDEEVNRRLFCGHNHCTTVMLAGLPANGPKYAGDICTMFSDCVEPRADPRGKALHFDGSKYSNIVILMCAICSVLLYSDVLQAFLLFSSLLTSFPHCPPTHSLSLISSPL
jgi:ATP-dependent RNA helicase TDRD9